MKFETCLFWRIPVPGIQSQTFYFMDKKKKNLWRRVDVVWCPLFHSISWSKRDFHAMPSSLLYFSFLRSTTLKPHRRNFHFRWPENPLTVAEMGTVNNTVDTVNAAASAIVYAESRIQPTTTVPVPLSFSLLLFLSHVLVITFVCIVVVHVANWFGFVFHCSV